MPTFFTPSNTNTSGWQKVSNVVSLVTSTDKVLVGLSSTDVAGIQLVSTQGYSAVDASSNASMLFVGVLTGQFAEIASTITGTGTFLPIAFFTNASERMRLDTSGQLGIGLTNASALLHVKSGSDGVITKFERTAGSVVGINLTTSLAQIGTTNNLPFQLTTNSLGALYIDTSQNVGVGNTSPQTVLDVTGTVAASKANFGTHAEPPAGDTLYVTTAGGTRATINGNGSLVSLVVNNAAADTIQIGSQNNSSYFGTTTNGQLSIITNSTARITCFTNGHINLGNTVDQGFGLYVDTTSSFHGAVSYDSTITATDFTQQVSIGYTKVGSSAAVDSSAMVDVVSTTKGFLPPRMTTAQKNAISSPAEGLLVYDTSLHKLCVRVAAAWETITSA